MGNDKSLGWEQDFRDFLDAEAVAPPAPLSLEVLERVRAQLSPAFGRILMKLALAQLLAGTVSLLFCPQFGLSFTSSHGLMAYLMRFGEGACMAGCGALFTGVGILVACLALRPEEIRAFRERRFFQVLAVTALSLAAFLCAGADVVAGLALVWALGATAGGLAVLEVGWRVRKYSVVRGPA
jgi:hypothetical protein